jgi:phosphoribosylanthranilate isomerase
MSTFVKICGITTPEAMTAALEAGADFVGLVFHPASPRNVSIEVAAYLSSYVPDSVKVVGLFVDPGDKMLTETLENVRIDLIQLHGNETLERVLDIKTKFGKPIIKALPITTAEDVTGIKAFEAIADWVLLDSRGGGTGKSFDWKLLDGVVFNKPWMLAGGLTPGIVSGAIKRLHPIAVDVSSGVEALRGVKDPAKIRAFIEAAKNT